MSKNQKVVSERKHRMVHNFLVKNFPSCEVTYNGVEGFDHEIIFNDKPTVLETKTCRRIIKKYVKFDDKGILNQFFRSGQLKFDQRQLYPYEPLSQHRALIKQNGWYILVIGNTIVGISAKDIDQEIGGHWLIKRVVWDRLVFICYPDWLEKLKMQVYGIG